MMKLSVSVFLVLLAVPVAADLPSARPDCARPSADQFFFPGGVLGKRTKQFDADQFERAWYSKHLRAMSEPSLSCTPTAAEAYRFLWLRTWGAPIAIRVARNGDDAILSAVILDGAGGHEPGAVSRRIKRKMSAEEWRNVSEGLSRIDFWKLPGQVREEGNDGAQWILEGRRGEQYHVVDRWSPETGAYREFCLSLVKIAGLLPSGTGKRDAIY